MLSWALGRGDGGGRSSKTAAAAGESFANPNINNREHNRRYDEEMNRLGVGLPPGGGGGRHVNFPPVDHLEIIRRNDHDGGNTDVVSGLTGVASAREAMMAKRRRRGGGERGERGGGAADGRGRGDGNQNNSGGRGGDHRRLDGFEEERRGGGEMYGRNDMRRRSYSWGQYPANHHRRDHYNYDRRSPSRSRGKRRRYSSRSRSPSSDEQRSRHDRRRGRRREEYRSRSNDSRYSRSRSRSSNYHRRGGRRRDREGSRNRNNNRRNHNRGGEEVEQNEGRNNSSPAYIVSEDSDKECVDKVAAAALREIVPGPGETAALKASEENSNEEAALRARSDAKKKSGSGKKRSRREDDKRDDSKKGSHRRHHRKSRRRHRSRSRSYSSRSSSSRSSWSSVARDHHHHDATHDADLAASYYWNAASSYNPPPPGLSLGDDHYHHSRNSRSHSFGDEFASRRSGKKRRSKKTRSRRKHRSYYSPSRSVSHGQRNHSSYSPRRGKKRDDGNGHLFSDSLNKRQRRHGHDDRDDAIGSLGGRDDDFNRRSKKAKKTKNRRRRHRRSNDDAAAAAGGGGQSDSSRDDTVGHFRGGPGTMVGDRYRIIRDVGMGTFGRVVQCERLRPATSNPRYHRDGHFDTEGYYNDRGDSSFFDHRHDDQSNNHRTVAIKIVRNVPRYYESALTEGDICERVNREQSRQNKDLCAQMLDRFSLPTGHYCLVFECLGMSLYDFLKGHDYRPFPMFCVRDFARQLLETLDFLHGFGLIHTDLKPENILLSNNEEMTYRTYDGSSARIPTSTKVKIIDFGGATFDDERKSSIVNTRQYRAPEVILGLGWSYPSDLWSAGCIIAELYQGELLFATHDNAEHLALMERAVGPFPKDLLEKSTSSLARECFDSSGWHRIKNLSPRSIEHVRKMMPIEQMVSERDCPTGLGRLLRSLLTIDPKRRATAREALTSPFFTQLG